MPGAVDRSKVHERNRREVSRSAQQYIKSVRYGNRTRYVPDLTAARPVAQPCDRSFRIVFGYGRDRRLNSQGGSGCAARQRPRCSRLARVAARA